MKITSTLKFFIPLLLATSISNGTVLIGNGINNGELADSGAGWTSTYGGFSVTPGDTSSLTTGPFGVQTPGSGSFYINSDFGAQIRSSAISLTAGEELIFAFDYVSQHNAAVSMDISVVDGLGFSQSIYSFNSFVVSGYVLHEAQATFAGATGDYQLQITYSPSQDAADISVDRVYLSAVPEPSSALLLGGGLGLALLRRKRRSA